VKRRKGRHNRPVATSSFFSTCNVISQGLELSTLTWCHPRRVHTLPVMLQKPFHRVQRWWNSRHTSVV